MKTKLLRGKCKLLLTILVSLIVDSDAYNVVHMSAEQQEVTAGYGKFSATKFAFAKHFQSNMVLQREPQQANIYGFHPEIGQKIVMTVTVTNASSPDYYETRVKEGPEPGVGVWTLTLRPTAAGTTVSIRVDSEQGTLHLDNIIFGDVWICSGQSNMEFTVKMMTRAKEELADAHNYPNIRIFAVAENQWPMPLYDIIGVLEKWSEPSKKTLGGKPWTYFSAVCWMYGKYIHKALGIPIGLVDTNWGGTPVEAWSSPDALAKCGIKSDSGNLISSLYVSSKNVTSNVKIVRGPSSNSVLWNAMVSPLLGMTIYGVVWYQGENDQHHPMVDRYNCTFPAMIDDWRLKFNSASNGQISSSFPFGFVQIASNVPDPSIDFGLPDIRWHQTADYGYVPNARLSNVFMAVAMDLPGFTSPYGTIHPQDKTDVGYRLSLSGLQYAYNMVEVSAGPYPSRAKIEGDKVVITYGNVKQLDIRDWKGFDLLCGPKESSNSSSQRWLPTSMVSNSTNTVSLYLNICSQGEEVKGIRYAWRESPCAFKKCAVYGGTNDLPGPQFIAYSTKQANGDTAFDFSGPTLL